jgi:hypothetical protein
MIIVMKKPQSVFRLLKTDCGKEPKHDFCPSPFLKEAGRVD